MLGELLGRLKQRRVFRVAGVYAVTGYAAFQVANNLLPALNLPRWTVSLVAAIYLIGFPIALVMAYAFEHTPQGIRRTRTTQGSPGVRLGWFDWTLLAGTMVLVGFAIVQFGRLSLQAAGDEPAGAAAAAAAGGGGAATQSADAAPHKSIAVLPFVNFSDSRDAEYFADGLTEELINGLAQLPDLRVAGRTSAFYFKGRNEDLREIGRKLGVAHVLEGSVRRSGDQLRITAQLISVADGFHMWSQTYDRPLRDVFEIQTQIATSVAQTLKTRLLGTAIAAPGSESRNPEAYQLELIARSQLRTQELQNLQSARQSFERLAELESDNARAFAGFAEATIVLAQNHLALDFDQAYRQSATAVERALRIDPLLADAWRVKGLISRVHAIRSGREASNEASLAAFRRAVELDPRDSDALAMLAGALGDTGQSEQAIAMLRRALEIDPLSRIAQNRLGRTLAEQGRFAEARRQYEQLVELYPDFTNARVALAQLHMDLGRLDEAVAELNDPVLIRADPLAGLMLANCYANLEMPREMQQLLEGIREPPTAAALSRAALLQRQGRRRELLELSAQQLRATRDPVWRFVSLMTTVLNGDVAGMRAALPVLAPELLEDPRAIGAHAGTDVLLLAEAMRRTGSPQRADAVLRALIAENTPPPNQNDPLEKVRLRMLAHASLGEIEQATTALRKAQARGFRQLIDFDYFVRLEDYPFLARAAADPGFKAVIREIERDNRRMQGLVRSASATTGR